MSEAAVALTADLVARAIIAAAHVYGDSPVMACLARSGRAKRSLSAAAAGIGAATGRPIEHVCPILGSSANAVMGAIMKGRSNPQFGRAVTAAERAARYAAWRPEAAESVAGGDAHEVIEPEAAADAEIVEAPRIAPRMAPAAAPAVAGESPLADLVLAALADGPLNTMSIASLIDRKEMAVVSTLSNLEHLGLVASSPADNGPRKFVWLRLDRQDAAA